jgi:hypothetical protein
MKPVGGTRCLIQKRLRQEYAMGFAIAGIALSSSVLTAAIGRGDITTEEARAIISHARKFLEQSAAAWSSSG